MPDRNGTSRSRPPRATTSRGSRRRSPEGEASSLDEVVRETLALLERKSTRRDHDNLARFGITANRAFGVSMAAIQAIGRVLGRDHELALALWETGWYEARLLAAFVDEPERVTAVQMDRWCADFDNWGVCDTLCFKLFDQTPHAWRKVAQWARRKDEFEKRAAFALLASLAGHDKAAADERFFDCLPLIERAASDDRNFVKKGVSWALRMTGRRSRALHSAALELAGRLASSDDASSRWIGRDARRDLTNPKLLASMRRRG